MYKKSLYFILIGFVILLITFILFVFNFKTLKNTIERKNEMSIENTTLTSDIENIDTLVIKTSNEKLNFILSDEPQVKVNFQKNENLDYTLEKSGNIITLAKKLQFKIFNFDFSFLFTDLSTTITIPKDTFKTIKIKNSNSSISLKELELESLEITTSNGKITLENIQCSDDIYLQTSNATITTNQITTNSLRCYTSNGHITLEDANMQDAILKTSNSSISLNNIHTSTLNANTSNGRIKATIEGKKEDYSISVKTSNGKITLDDLVLDTKRFRLSNDNKNTKRLELNTSNSSINLSFI